MSPPASLHQAPDTVRPAGPAQAARAVRVVVYHNIVWSRYKGAVFSALHALPQPPGWQVAFVQIAETEGERAALSGVDLRYHQYPFDLLFRGAYDALGTGRLAWTLGRHVLRNRADLVVLPGYHRIEYWAMLLACIASGKRRAVFCDSTGQDKAHHPVKSLLKRLFFRACDGYFGYGQRSADYLRASGARPDRIFARCQAAALPIGFDADNARSQRLQALARGGEPRFLYVGRLAPEKDLATLLRAFAAHRAAGLPGTLVLVGAGPLRDALAAHGQALGLGDHLQMPGAMDLDGVAAEYARALCLVLPSTSEPWGLVVNEALHHGCPAIVSEACGCRPELIVDGVTGLAFATGDEAQLTLRLRQALTTFADSAAVTAACQRHIAQFRPEQAAQHILQGCQAILAAPH